MSFDTFTKLIDDFHGCLCGVELYNWGEPFLNKDVFRMIEYARRRKITVAISTNLNTISEEICANIIDSGLNTLIVSLDGASHESVAKYQKGNDYERVIANIKAIVHAKETAGRKTPFVTWRFLVNRFNEHEIERAKQVARELRIDSLEFGPFRCDMTKELFMDNEAQYSSVASWLPADERWSMYDYVRRQKKNVKTSCSLLWAEAVINSSGAVSPCCAVWDEKFDFGNILEAPFYKIWNGEKYKDARRMNKGADIQDRMHICCICRSNKAII